MHRRLPLVAAGALALGVAALLPQTVSGAAPPGLFVTPTGSGSACTAVAPCSIGTGFSHLFNGGDLTIEAGTYGSPATPLTTGFSTYAVDASVHGPSAGVRPVIYSSASIGLSVAGDGNRVSDIDFRDTASGSEAVRFYSTTHATRIRAQATTAGVGCELVAGAVITDSICIGAGAGGAGIDSDGVLSGSTVFAANVLAIGNGSANGVLTRSLQYRNTEITLVNSIARGGGYDLNAYGDPSSLARIIVRDSQYVTTPTAPANAFIVDAGDNIAVPPTFKTGTDFEPAAAAPTFDVGDDGSADDLAYTGDPRTMGAHTDIGPYERLVAPTATNPSVDAVSDTGAALHGVADTHLVGGTYQFLYGPTTSYGATTPAQALAPGEVAHGVTQALSGLTPGTTYHAKLLVQGRGGSAGTTDLTFTTSPAPAPVTNIITTPGPTVTLPGKTVTVIKTITPAPTCHVPSVKAGATVAAARRALKKAHCKVGKTTKVHSHTRTGRVVRLAAKKGASTTAAVGVVVSSGRAKKHK